MNFIPVNEPYLKGNEKKYLTECVESGWISSEGPFVKKFEESFSYYIGRKYGISVSNGSAALDLAFFVLGISKGDEVIMPAFTIISCANSIIRCGGKPVLVDCDPNTWNMNVNEIEKKITRNTKAILVVHIYGLSVDMDPILELAKKYNLKIIEDAAEAHGLEYKNKKCGSFGDISIFSFYSNKLISMGEGGIILVDDLELAEKCNYFKNLCFKKDQRFVHDDMGWNFRLTNIQAAIGLAQLEQIDYFLKRKREIGNYYNSAFSKIDSINIPIDKTDYSKNVYWIYGLVLNNSKLTAKNVIDELAKKNIGARPFFYPINKQPVFNKKGLFVNEKYLVSENLYNKGFYIPNSLSLTNEKMDYIIDSIKEVIL